MRQRLRLEVRGAVQGVGFRPHVYRVATSLGLGGWVRNDARGLFLEVEGEGDGIAAFRERLREAPPPRARIHEILESWLPPEGEETFRIETSGAGGTKSVLVLPDIGTCCDCLAEILDPSDRRFRYPFTN